MPVAAGQVMIRDCGELSEIRALLDEMGIPYAQRAPGASGSLPTNLLITLGSYAVEVLGEIKRSSEAPTFLHVVIIDRASRSLRGLLQREGCDVIARRPIHPTAMRLLVQRSLYHGREKRKSTRVAIGSTVKLKTGMFSRSAVLAEISIRGCGLLTDKPLEIGMDVKVSVPRILAGKAGVNLPGRVVGVQRDIGAEDGRHASAIVFGSTAPDEKRTIKAIMDAHAVGQTGVVGREFGTTTDEPEPTGSGSEAGRDRRVAPRGQYDHSVLARGSGGTHSLIGRDLSVGGMRVAPEPGLQIGMRLQLAVYGHAGVPPVIVAAVIVRDDGASGLGLRFDPLPGGARKRLESVVASLEGLDEGPEGSARPATVVTEVLETG